MRNNKYEFKVGDVLIKIGETKRVFVYAVDHGFYYMSNMDTGSAFVLPREDCEGKFVAVDWMTNDAAHCYINEMKICRNSTYGCI